MPVSTDSTSRSRSAHLAVPWLVAASLITLIGVWLLLTLDPTMAWGGDNAMYLMLARNLANGTPYNITGYVQNPNSYLAPQTYPPIFPLLLSPVYALFGLNIVAFKIQAIVIYLIALALFAGLSRDAFRERPIGNFYWLALIPLIGMSPRLVGWTRLILSDAAFLGACAASLWILRVAYGRLDRRAAGTAGLAVLAGLVMSTAIGTRIIGATLILSVIVFELTRHRAVTRVGVVAVCSGLVFWLLQTIAVDAMSQPQIAGAGAGGGQGYGYVFRQDLIHHLGDMPATALHNLLFYWRVLSQFWYAGTLKQSLPIQAAIAASLIIFAVGLVQQIRHRYTVSEVFCLVYFLAVLPWHAYGTRYLVPVIPFYFLYLVLGLQVIGRALPPRMPVPLIAVLAVAGISYASSAWATANFQHTISPTAPNGAAAMDAYRYIRQHTNGQALIIARDPRATALFTDRRAVIYADRATMYRLQHPTRLIAYFDAIGAGYLLTSPFDTNNAAMWLALQHPDRFREIFRNPYFVLYRLKPAAAAARSSIDTQGR